MPKRKSAEERLVEVIKEIGLERAESAFRLLKSYTTVKPDKPETKQRKKPVAFESKAAV